MSMLGVVSSQVCRCRCCWCCEVLVIRGVSKLTGFDNIPTKKFGIIPGKGFCMLWQASWKLYKVIKKFDPRFYFLKNVEVQHEAIIFLHSFRANFDMDECAWTRERLQSYYRFFFYILSHVSFNISKNILSL